MAPLHCRLITPPSPRYHAVVQVILVNTQVLTNCAGLITELIKPVLKGQNLLGLNIVVDITEAVFPLVSERWPQPLTANLYNSINNIEIRQTSLHFVRGGIFEWIE